MKKKVNKNCFDGIANKFDENIYGTAKGQLRHKILTQVLVNYMTREPMQVLDAGGGTGMMSLEFAKQGHNVTLADTSEDAIDIAKQRLLAYPKVTFCCDDLQNLSQSYDFIICHAVLEWSKEPLQLLRHLLAKLKPDGVMSLSFFNHDAKVFNNLLYGNFKYVTQGMPSKNTVRLNPHNAQKPKEIIGFIKQFSNISIINTRGIRCFHDYMLDKQKALEHPQELFEMELCLGNEEPYKWLGKYFHILLESRYPVNL